MEGGGSLVVDVKRVVIFGTRHIVGFVVDGFGIPDGAVGKDDFFYLVVRCFLVAVVVAAKVLTYGYFVICTFYG